LLKTSGAVIQEKEGKHKDCWVMKLDESAEFEGMNEPDKILVRSNGTVTYTGKDIAYQLWKFGLLDRTFNFRKFSTYDDGHILWETTSGEGDPGAPRFGGAQKVVNVIDVRQSYLQKVVKEGVRQLGHVREAENSIHYSYEMVALTPATAKALGIDVSEEDSKKPYIEMSGRKGLGVKADDLIDALQSKAAESVREGSKREGLSDSDVEQLGREIAVAALRYFMLKYGRNKVIAFDFNEALTFEGDSGPYLQYSTVRVQNIFWRVQVKSVLARTPSRRYYRVKTSVGGGSRGPATTYSTTEIDFLAAYIFQEDLWYVFPAAVIEGRTCVCLAPGSKRSKYEKYCEAWKLMNPAITVVEPGLPSKLDGDSGSAFAETFTAAAAIAPGA